MFNDFVTPEKICNYNEALTWANSVPGKNYLISRNKKIKNLFPLTEQFLKNNYAASNFVNYKKTFPDVNCANDSIGLLVATYGFLPGGTNPTGADAAQSSGLNPLFGFPFNLGFDFGSSTYNYLWILIALAAAIYLSKK